MEAMPFSSLPPVHSSLNLSLVPLCAKMAGRELVANVMRLQLQGWTGERKMVWLCHLLGSEATAKQFLLPLRPLALSEVFHYDVPPQGQLMSRDNSKR